MSWAPKDLEDELFDDISNLTLEESPTFFNTLTEVNNPVSIKKLDVTTKQDDEKQNEEATSKVVLSIAESLRIHGIESKDVIPKISTLSSCVSKNDFSDSRFPLILEDKYFTMKIVNHQYTSNQAKKMLQLPTKSDCVQPINESWERIEKRIPVNRPKSPEHPGEDKCCNSFEESNCPVKKSNKFRKKKTKIKMKPFDWGPQEVTEKINRMAPPGFYGIAYI
ncbi:unnamed protein product [Diamesa serratosioi]